MQKMYTIYIKEIKIDQIPFGTFIFSQKKKKIKLTIIYNL